MTSMVHLLASSLKSYSSIYFVFLGSIVLGFTGYMSFWNG